MLKNPAFFHVKLKFLINNLQFFSFSSWNYNTNVLRSTYFSIRKRFIRNSISNCPVNPRNQSSMLNFCAHSRSESSFSFPINTKHLFVYGNHEKNIKFNHNSFVNERKKLNFVLYSIPGIRNSITEIRNPLTQKLSFL